jgi:hypothetical protein
MKNGLTIYKNAVVSREHNRRMMILKRRDSGLVIQMRSILPESELSFSGNQIFRGKLKQTSFSLTDEASEQLLQCLFEYFQNIYNKTEQPGND